MGGLAVPGIFVREGKTQAAAVNEDGSPNDEPGAVPIGSGIAFNVTGIGLVDPALEDGQTVGEDGEVRPTQPD